MIGKKKLSRHYAFRLAKWMDIDWNNVSREEWVESMRTGNYLGKTTGDSTLAYLYDPILGEYDIRVAVDKNFMPNRHTMDYSRFDIESKHLSPLKNVQYKLCPIWQPVALRFIEGQEYPNKIKERARAIRLVPQIEQTSVELPGRLNNSLVDLDL